jgi:hypothetical protein
MKDVLLLHDNARPHTGLRTREAIEKMGWNFPARPAHSPDLAPSDCHLFGPSRDAMRGRDFAYVTVNWNKVFVMWSEVEAGNFTALAYSVLLNVGKSVLKMEKILWKNSLIIAKVARNHSCKLHCYGHFIFWQKTMEALFRTAPRKIRYL